jgi:7-carboxy-7-deazaguanine synthase
MVNTEKKVMVSEIFGPTIQGEGAMIGVKTMFVRTAGCDFKCTKCDSLHSVLPALINKLHREGKTRLMYQQEIAQELIQKMEETGTQWVTLSGGNPALWDMTILVLLLKAAGYYVAVETQGTVWRDWLLEVDQLTISPKGPGMGEKFNPIVFKTFCERIMDSFQRMTGALSVCIKVVIFDQQDLEFAVGIDEILDAYNKSPNSGWWPKHDRYLSVGNPYPPAPNPDGTMNTEPFEGDMGEGLQETLIGRYKDLLEMDYLNDPRLAHWKFLPQLHVLVWANKAEV